MEKFRRECEDLHKNIEKSLDPDIDRILKEYPDEKYFYNEDMESAAAIALKHKQIKIFSLLISKGFSLGQHEDANELLSRFDPRMKEIIVEINKKNSIEVADHVSILISKSKISHNACENEVSEMEQCIRKAFIDLDQISQIQPILKVVAYADKLSINFDFCDDKISNMNPMKSKSVRGCCYTTGRWEGDIFIGAKGLMRADKEYLETLGTLAHELCHYAMLLVYQNHCKPYKFSQDNERAFREPAEKLRKTEKSGNDHKVLLRSGTDDESSTERLNERLLNYVCKKCEENCKAEDSEPCINIVFRHPEPKRHAELIVRVPQIMVLYRNDKAKLSQIESTYFELFYFFEEKILVNIESVLPRMKTIYKLNQAYQSKHQNIEHYVERKFIRLNANYEKVSENPMTEDQLIKQVKNLKILLLSDEPGAGKTTNLIAIAGKLKKRYPGHWIVVIELKEFADYYKRDGDKSTTFSTISDIKNYYCEKIFKFKNPEAKYFAKLFEDNRVIFLMDGFDEISPTYKEFNLKLINAITRESDNRIWISTRPHLERELQNKLNCRIFRLNPFTIDDRRNFLELKWKSEIIDKKVLNEKIQKVENILNEIIEKSAGLDPTSNALILTMISETLDDLSNQSNSQMNLYSIYETFVNKKKKIFYKKGPEAEEQISDPYRWLNINVFHHEIALITLLYRFVEFGGMTDFWPSLCGRTTLPSSEEITRLGLMVYVENSNEICKNFRFIHRTFAEYFVADFIIEGFSKFNVRENYGTQEWLSRGKSLEIILNLSTDSRGVDTEQFFNFILEEHLLESSTRKFSDFTSLTMVRHFIYSFWKTRSFIDYSRNKKLQNFERALNSPGRLFENLFHAALKDGSDCWLKDVPETLEMKLRSVEFWKPWNPKENSAMMLSAKQSSIFFSEFLEFINKFVDQPIWREMFFDLDEMKRNILCVCPLETFTLILSGSPMIPLIRQEKVKLLQTSDLYGLNVLLFYVTCKSKEEFQKYYEVVNDFDEGMPEKLLHDFSSNEYHQSFLHYWLNWYNNYYFESSLKIVGEFFELRTIREMFKIKNGSRTLLILLPSRIRETEKVNIFWNFFEDIFEDEAERIEIMCQENAEGCTVFDLAFFIGDCYFDGTVKYIKEKYKIAYSEEVMRRRIMKNISSFSEAHKANLRKYRYWSLNTLMTNIINVFSKDFVRSLFISYDEKPTFLKDEKTMTVLKPLLIENKILSDDEMSKLLLQFPSGDQSICFRPKKLKNLFCLK